MDDKELTNLARKWAVSVGIVERAQHGITHATQVLQHAQQAEAELRDQLQAEANQRPGLSLDVGGYRIDLAPNEAPVRTKL